MRTGTKAQLLVVEPNGSRALNLARVLHLPRVVITPRRTRKPDGLNTDWSHGATTTRASH